MNRRKTIGFDRRLAFDWLEATASRVAAGDSLEELRAGMWAYLEGKESGDKFNSDRGKTMTVLTRIWGKVPPAVEHLKTRAVAAFQTSKAREHLALHWAMAIASYPIFSDVAATAGRLLTLQDSFSLAQLTNRMVAQWSERPVLVKSTQRIIRSLVDWGALRTPRPGAFMDEPQRLCPSPERLRCCCARRSCSTMSTTPCPPTSFWIIRPYSHLTHSLTMADLREESVFDVHRQGIDGDMVELRSPQAS